MLQPKLKNRKLNRLKDYDYSQEGYYFVSICTKEKEAYFGRMENEKMILNEYGEIVKRQWLWLENQYGYVCLDEFIVMPNHFHGILVIDNNFDNKCRDRSRPVPTVKIKSLSELIGVFKTTSSKSIHQNGLVQFKWQRSFYDHIIRNDKSLNNIRKYIIDNPLKWDLDENNLQNME